MKSERMEPGSGGSSHIAVPPNCVLIRVSEPACFGAAPALAPGIFHPEPAPGKREQNVGIFKIDYKLSKLRSNTCTSTCRSYFLFTLEKTSNDVKFHVIFVNY